MGMEMNWVQYKEKRKKYFNKLRDHCSVKRAVLNAKCERLIGNTVLTLIEEKEKLKDYRCDTRERIEIEAAAIARTAFLLKLDARIVKRDWEWISEGKIYDAEQRMQAERKAHALQSEFSKIPRCTHAFLEKEIDNAVQELKGHATVTRILEIINEKWQSILEKTNLHRADNDGSTPLFPLKKTQFHVFMVKILGFEYNRVQKVMKKLTPKRRRRLRRYLMELSTALRLEAEGTHVIVYMDETYCHQHHAPARAWLHSQGNEHQSKGPRLIIVQAITKDGILYTDETKLRHWWSQDDDLSEQKCVTELIYPAGKQKKNFDGTYSKMEGQAARGDYHLNMDGVMFMQWVNNYLTPTFNTKYEGKKMILVLDNAKYHHGHGSSYINTSTCPKYLLMGLIRRYNGGKLTHNGKEYSIKRKASPTIRYPLAHVTSANSSKVTVRFAGSHEEAHVHLQDCYAATDRKPGLNPLNSVTENDFVKVKYAAWDDIPLRAEIIQNEVHKLLEKKAPHVLESELEKWASDHGHILVFTPPYCPDLQPIELVWAIVKGRVARDWYPERTLRETFQQLCNGFYGGPTRIKTRWKKIGARLCQRLIRRSVRMAQKRLDADPLLSGTIMDLDVSRVPKEELMDWKLPFEFEDDMRGNDWSNDVLQQLQMVSRPSNSGDGEEIEEEAIYFSDWEDETEEGLAQSWELTPFKPLAILR